MPKARPTLARLDRYWSPRRQKLLGVFREVFGERDTWEEGTLSSSDVPSVFSGRGVPRMVALRDGTRFKVPVSRS